MQTDTELALLRAIAANPGEETPRLMYIDCCLEHDPERAELIQIQTQHDQMKTTPCHCGDSTDPTGCGRCVSVSKRWKQSDRILAKNTDRWLRVACPECVAGLVPNLTGEKQSLCLKCGATGDVCQFTHPGTPSRDLFKVEWKAGFPHKVTGAKHADVFRQMYDRVEQKCDGCRGRGTAPADWPGGFNPLSSCELCKGVGRVVGPGNWHWEPTEVAKVWLTHHPMIKEIEIGDVMPSDVGNFRAISHNGWDGWHTYRILEPVYDLMTTEQHSSRGDRDWDRQDHSRAVADWVRSFLK